MAVYQQQASPPTGEYDLGGMVRSMLLGMLCACGMYNLVIQGIANRVNGEHISGGGWGGGHICHG